MRIRRHMSYANVMATIAAFGVVAGGGAYAASKIDTADIANKAVTARKLDRGAVRTTKIRAGAVTSAKLGEESVENRNLSPRATLPMAGVLVYNNEIRGWFNRFNDLPPMLEHTQPGIYDLQIPGVNEDIYSSVNLLSSVSPTTRSSALVTSRPLARPQSTHQSRWPSTSSRRASPRLGAPMTRISRPSAPAS